MSSPRSIVVAVSGASGSIYARRLLELLAAIRRGEIAGIPARPELAVSWVATTAAETVWRQELGEEIPARIEGLQRFATSDFSAPFASGSSAPDVVLVAPCSMSTLARVAHGGGDDLVARACEVALKERRKLILLARETPLSLVHLENMAAATRAGATIMPAVPSFYAGIETLAQAVDTVVVRALDHAGLPLPLLQRWGDSR